MALAINVTQYQLISAGRTWDSSIAWKSQGQ